MSGFPSPLKSPTVAAFRLSRKYGSWERATAGAGFRIVKRAVFEVCGLFPRFTTVTEAKFAVVRSEVLMGACKTLLDTTTVARCEPFHSKTAEGAKFAPCTVSVNPWLPGSTVVGDRGCEMYGTGTF